MNWSGVLFINGVLLATLGSLMCVPIVLEFCISGNFPIDDFLLPIGGCFFIGLSLVLSNKTSETIQIDTTDAFLLTSLTWFIIPVFAGLPFLCCAPLNLSFFDSWYESVSTLTTTGCTLIRDISVMPSWIVTWRFLLSYVGGVGMILMGMIVLPILRIGGMQLFRTEYSDRNEKILPSVAQIATWIVGVYSGLIAISAVLLRLSGLSLRDSVCYAISTVSTSGIPTYSNSLMSLNNVWSEVIILVGMILGGSSLLLFIKGLKGNFGAVKKDIQLKGYLETLLAFSLITTWLRWYNSDLSLFNSVREGALSAVSFITTTGAFNSDYEKWGPFAMLLFPIMSLVGGCTGSTSGGIKIFRFQILFTCAKAHIQQLRCPHGVFIPVYNGQKVTDTVAFSVFVFIALYIITICSASLLLALCGFDFETSVSAAIATVGNVGAGIGSLVGTGGAPCSVAVGAKMVLIVCMILGRLELLTLLTLLLPSFWRK